MEPSYKERPTLFVVSHVNNTVNDNGTDLASFVNIKNIDLIWIIGVPVAILIICFILAYWLNEKWCKKEAIDYDDPSDDEQLEMNQKAQSNFV